MLLLRKERERRDKKTKDYSFKPKGIMLLSTIIVSRLFEECFFCGKKFVSAQKLFFWCNNLCPAKKFIFFQTAEKQSNHGDE